MKNSELIIYAECVMCNLMIELPKDIDAAHPFICADCAKRYGEWLRIYEWEAAPRWIVRWLETHQREKGETRGGV